MKKPMIKKFFYLLRNFRSAALFKALGLYCSGTVLDVGGWDFYQTVRRKEIRFDSWTVLEPDKSRLATAEDVSVRFIAGDGCAMGFRDNSFDTLINIQVLEHVFEPLRMMKEMQRVLKPGGHLVMLVPQTARLHMAPHHYYNFTRFWIEKAVAQCGMKLIELKPIGGIWTSMASHFFYFFFQSLRYQGTTIREYKRNAFFYTLYPLMVLFAICAIPLCMLLSLGDLAEEPNNHLVVAKKIH